jgi:hypothetical protein
LIAQPGVVSRHIADETLLVPVTSRVGDLDSIYTLMGIGPRVWALLQQPVTPQQIVDAVCDEYDVARDIATRDVTEFLDLLSEKKLIAEAATAGV